ncbi:MAG: tetratricopeptide repeat protein [Verrucomicrobiae bacterium]|nr:tetratricopeptide repeat protein [Verrucomicrobiae bacterium]
MTCALCLQAAGKRNKNETGTPDLATPSNASTRFAPVAADHPLAEIWNDPDFTRRLLGTYGFNSAREPSLNLEEQTLLREQILPVLRMDPTNAIPLLEAAVKPDASAVFDYTLGNVLFQSGDTTNAIRNFEAAVSKFPDYERAWKNLGFAQVRDGHYAESIKPLARTVELGGADGEVFGLLGFAYLNSGRPVSAGAALQQALLFRPDDFNLQLYLLQAWVAGAQYEPALKLLNELLAVNPERANLWSLLANIQVERNELPAAAVAYETLRRLGGATSANLMLLGDIYLAQEARELALGAYLEALKSEGGGDDPSRELRAAELLITQGAWDEARALLAAIRSATGETLAGELKLKLLKLEARLALAADRGDEAIAILEKISLEDPLDGEALLLAADYYAGAGEREKAEFRYDAASKIEGFEADAFVGRARLLVKQQEYRRAAEFLQKAQKIKPRDRIQRYLDQVLQLAAAGSSKEA